LADGRSRKQIIGNMAAKLGPTQQSKILVGGYTDNAPIGPAPQRQGITSNQILSQERAENVMEFKIRKTLREPHCEHTSRRRHSGTGVSGPYQRACSAGSGSLR
jgi:flagellar motor protein MotB